MGENIVPSIICIIPYNNYLFNITTPSIKPNARIWGREVNKFGCMNRIMR